MKKVLFWLLSIFAGFISLWLALGAGVLTKDGASVEDYLASYFGIISPMAILEGLKLICFKKEYRKIYAFDMVCIVICAIAISILSFLMFELISSSTSWGDIAQEFFFFLFPWIISLVGQTLLLVYKGKKRK